MEKLELKHLAPYLPYDLKYVVNHNDILKGSGDIEEIEILDIRSLEFCLNHKIKLLLHPLSDLTKEIEVNGNKLVTASMLWSVEVQEEEAFEVYGEVPEYWKHCIEQVKTGRVDYKDMVILFKYHFDVFGLIEKGLAIDLNTIENSKITTPQG